MRKAPMDLMNLVTIGYIEAIVDHSLNVQNELQI